MKDLKNAILNKILADIDRENNGMLSAARVNFSDLSLLRRENVTFRNNDIFKDGVIIAHIKRRYAAKKVNGAYKQLKPIIEYM